MDHQQQRWWRRAHLAFDPVVSPRIRYEVLVPPPEPGKPETAEERATEWPPAMWTWDAFSSAAGRWKQAVFVREGDAAGTALSLRFGRYSYDPVYYDEPRWYNSAYWKGALYLHCRGEYVAR